MNIRRDVSDKFYRYKMPQLQVKIEGKGNGIKTVIPNMSDIARSLSRPAAYPTKFFGCELGAQTTFDDKTDRYIVNGAHDSSRLRDLLDTFIDKFVLCPSCKNPETELIITKDEFLTRDCKACGTRGVCDMRHKLVTFILKNPPKKVAKGKKGGKKDIAGAGDGIGGFDEGSEEPKEIKDIIAGKEVDIPTLLRDDKDEEWSVDTSKEAVNARLKSLSLKDQNGLAATGDEEDEEGNDTPYDKLGEWLEDDPGERSEAEILGKMQELGIEGKHKTLTILIEKNFGADCVVEIKKHHSLLKKLTTSEKHQKALLGGIERLVGLENPDLLPAAIPKILMDLYQADVLEEEIIKNWGTHVSKKFVDKETSKKVRRAAEPMLKWLDQADESDDE